MVKAKDCYLVMAWVCGSCGHTNYHRGCSNEAVSAVKEEIAAELGCDPDELAAMPSEAHCVKCEEMNSFIDEE